MAETNILQMQKVNKFYGSGELKVQVLYDIDLEFSSGSFNSIVGQSGSGKSTLMNIMGTLDRASSGQVFVDQQDISGLKSNQLSSLRNLTIGFVFQFHYLLPEFTARENVLMPVRIKGQASLDQEEKADELLDLVGIARVKNNLSTKMSGGQQQRAAIARALMMNPKIILADEPTGNLDSDSTQSIYKLFRQINQELGTTFIIITHDRRIAEQTDRIIEIQDGRIQLDVRK